MNNCEIILSGFGGQGILFAGKVIANAAMMKNKNISWLPSYGPEMRGGTANCHVIISDEQIGSPIIQKPDVLVAMNRPSIDKFEDDVKNRGIIFIDTSLVNREVERDDVRTVGVAATEIAEKIGEKKLANMVMLGKVMKETGLFTIEEMNENMKKIIPVSKQKLAELNMKAVEAGYNS